MLRPGCVLESVDVHTQEPGKGSRDPSSAPTPATPVDRTKSGEPAFPSPSKVLGSTLANKHLKSAVWFFLLFNILFKFSNMHVAWHDPQS